MVSQHIEDDTGRRIGLFFVGLGMAAFFAFLSWVSLALPSIDNEPAESGFWAQAGEQLAGDPAVATVVGLSGLAAGLGVVFMVWAVVGHRKVG